MAAETVTLTPAQSHALFDVLTHYTTYAEVQDFRSPSAIEHYGPPFQSSTSVPDAERGTPILQSLLSKFALPLPGLRDVLPEFWTVRVKELIHDLAAAELSESYDKGLLGVRKTLATAISALIEYPARGCLGGVEDKRAQNRKTGDYDPTSPEDVMRSWHVALQEMVYGDFIDEIFQRAAETDDLEQHSGLVQCMHEFVVVNLALLMHYTLILSPEGPTLLRMISNVHSLLPYMVVRQTLKIGNVATMIGAMMRVILAKASVATLTNWVGFTSGADEGMNLMQQIISQVLGWDKRDLRKRAEKIEKDSNAPPKEVLREIKSWITTRPRVEHEECRRMSEQQDMSIVAVIMATSSHSVEMTSAQHAKALEYLALQLGVRDRQEIVRVLCHHNPDHLTAGVREGVEAYTPMIREVHQAVNLADTVWDAERFITDTLKVSKGSNNGVKGEEKKPPSVEDYVDLLHRHQSSCHKFLHQVAKNGREIVGWWKEWVHLAAAQFRVNGGGGGGGGKTTIRASIEKAFVDELGQEDQQAVKAELDAWAKYVDELHAASAERIRGVIQRTGNNGSNDGGGGGGSSTGPGAFLARWQDLLDRTLLTPDEANGKVRSGADRSVREETRKGVDGGGAEVSAGSGSASRYAVAPSVERTIAVLGKRFREVVAAGG